MFEVNRLTTAIFARMCGEIHSSADTVSSYSTGELRNYSVHNAGHLNEWYMSPTPIAAEISCRDPAGGLRTTTARANPACLAYIDAIIITHSATEADA
jgi:hypothetical protein